MVLLVAVLLASGLMAWVTLRRPAPVPAAPKPTVSPAPTRAAHAPARDFSRSAGAVADSSPPPQPTAPPRSGKKPISDPGARTALKSVGTDPDAERRWLEAINNPFLPPGERQDLIEDLNEDGLSDPRNPGPKDLPLISSRLQLIERLMPEAMDRVNADAFQEARKDLVKMHAKLSQQ